MPVDDDRKKLIGCHIAVGAPGRIKHLLVSRVLNPKNIKLLILDEADVLINDNFIEDIKCIYSCLPSKKQVLASSATYSKQFSDFSKIFMKYPSTVLPKYETPVLLGVKQFVTLIKEDIADPFNINELERLLSQISFKQCIIFSNTKADADHVSVLLKRRNWPCEYFSSDQDQVSRLAILNKLKLFKCRILVTTDLTARGVDAENVNLVINMKVPSSHATYLHRIGRAGRYGTYGIAITIIKDDTELVKFKTILCKIGGNNMSVDILPQDKIPNIWDKKQKYNFNKMSVGNSIESPENVEEIENRRLVKNSGDLIEENANINENNVVGETDDFKQSLCVLKKELENGKCEPLNNQTRGAIDSFPVSNFLDLQSDMDIFLKSDISCKEILLDESNGNSGNDILDQSEIYNKLMKDSHTTEDFNSLLDDCDNSEFSEEKNDSLNSHKLENVSDETRNNSDFVTKLFKATSDINLNPEDSTDKVNILKKKKNEKKKISQIKPKPVTQKQLDDDRAFLELIKKNVSKDNINKSVLSNINNSNNSPKISDENVADEIRKAVLNVDSDTFKYENSPISCNNENYDINVTPIKSRNGIENRVKLHATRKCNIDILKENITEESNKNIQAINITNKRPDSADFVSESDNRNTSIPKINGNEFEKQTENCIRESTTKNLQKVNGPGYSDTSDIILISNESSSTVEDNKENIQITEKPQTDIGTVHLNEILSVSESKNISNSHKTIDLEAYKAGITCDSIQHSTLKSPSFRSAQKNAKPNVCENDINSDGSQSKHSEQVDTMLQYKKWNQLWMQQLWEINNFVFQNNVGRNMYLNLYHNQ